MNTSEPAFLVALQQMVGGAANYAVIVVVASWLLRVAFAIGIFVDIKQGKVRGRGPFLGGGVFWGLAALLEGFFVVALYWGIHYSTLRPRPTQPATGSQPEPTY